MDRRLMYILILATLYQAGVPADRLQEVKDLLDDDASVQDILDYLLGV